MTQTLVNSIAIVVGIAFPLPLLVAILYRWRTELRYLNTFRKYIAIVLFSVTLYPITGAYKDLLDGKCLDDGRAVDDCVDGYSENMWIAHRTSYVLSSGFLHMSGTVVHGIL